MSIAISFLGMAVLVLIAVIVSNNRRAINLRTVSLAFLLQFGMGALVLFVPWGQKALNTASEAVAWIIGFGNKGIEFLFGGLVNDKMFEVFGGGGFIFALRVLPMIIFFSSLIAVLYYLGIMQWIIRILGGSLHKLLNTSRAESMSAAANIFVGQTEAPLVVKPFIARMTQSELFAVMSCGLASVAGSVLAGYAAMGVPLPYLIAASFMSAPGGLLFAKLIVPETEHPESNEHMVNTFTAEGEEAPTNIIDAAAGGATTGMNIALNVGAMLLAFIAIIALLNGIIGSILPSISAANHWLFEQFPSYHHWLNEHHQSIIAFLESPPQISLEKILGWLFAPLAWLIGATGQEAQIAGSFIGQKLVVNEFVAYSAYMDYLHNPDTTTILSAKTQAIISFALCGFANFSSIAILVGGLTIMAPKRRKDIAHFGIRALIAGTLSNLMSATIAGLFIGLAGTAALNLT